MTLHPNEDTMAQAPQAPQAPVDRSPADLRWYIAITRRHKFLIGSVTALIMAATLLYTMQQTPMYTSTAKVLVKEIGLASYLYRSTGIAMTDERGIASSEPIATVVMERNHEPGPAATLLGGLSVTIVPDSSFLIFSYTSSSPETAQTMAQAFAEGYIYHRDKEATDYAKSQSGPQLDELAKLAKQIPQLEEKISKTKTSNPSWARMNALLANAYSRKSYLEQQMIPFKVFVADGGTVVANAQLPSVPSSPNYPRNLFLSMVLGLVIGAGATLARERLDDRLRGTRDLDGAIGAPILATIPKIRNWKKRDSVLMISTSSPRGPVAESYRTLRTNLDFIGRDDDFKVILVTSPAAGEGKTTTIANLAATMAQAGQRVIAVSCDLRKPRLHLFFGLTNEIGLSSILSGKATLSEAAQAVEGLDTLRIVVSGPVPANPAELLTSPKMAELIEGLRFHADFVLLDAPPVLAVSDALILGRLADGVVVLADAQTTSRSAAGHVREQLEQVGATIIGCVLNNFDPSQIRYYPYQNAYYYSPYYSGYKGYKGYGGYGYGGYGVGDPVAEPQEPNQDVESNGHKATTSKDDEMWLPES